MQDLRYSLGPSPSMVTVPGQKVQSALKESPSDKVGRAAGAAATDVSGTQHKSGKIARSWKIHGKAEPRLDRRHEFWANEHC